MIVVTEATAKEMDKACDPSNSGKAVEAFRELYSTADTLYCVNSATGCECYVNATSAHLTGAGYVLVNTSDTVTKVQECTAHLSQAYANYGISFDDIGELTKFLDHFGDIEKEYKCSGICTIKNRYYFSDINLGAPTSTCFDNIKNDPSHQII